MQIRLHRFTQAGGHISTEVNTPTGKRLVGIRLTDPRLKTGSLRTKLGSATEVLIALTEDVKNGTSELGEAN